MNHQLLLKCVFLTLTAVLALSRCYSR